MKFFAPVIAAVLVNSNLASAFGGADPNSGYGGYDDGSVLSTFTSELPGFELADFPVGVHTPARGLNNVHTTTEVAATEEHCQGVVLTYNTQGDRRAFLGHSWTWESPIFDTAVASNTFSWVYEFDHGWVSAEASATISIVVGGAEHVLAPAQAGRRGATQIVGTSTIAVEAGQAVSVKITGSTRNTGFQMSGSIFLRPQLCEELGFAPTVTVPTKPVLLDALDCSNTRTITDYHALGVTGTDNEQNIVTPVCVRNGGGAFEAGDNTVTCTVATGADFPNFDDAVATFTVTVLTGTDLIQLLLDNLPDTEKARLGRSLDQQLGGALEKFQSKGCGFNGACGSLNGFRSHVSAVGGYAADLTPDDIADTKQDYLSFLDAIAAAVEC